MRTHLLLPPTLCLLLAAPAAALAQPAQPAPPRPPVAAVRPVTDDYFGTKISDPYRWLEQPGPAFDAYLKAQARYADSTLARLPRQAELRARLRELAGATPASAGAVQLLRGEVYMYLKTPAGAQTPKLYRRRGLRGPETLLLDPDRFNTATDRYSLSYFVPAPDDARVVYALATNGSEKPVLRIRELATGWDLPEVIERADWEYARPEWRPDGRSFFYTRMQQLPAGAPATEVQQRKQVVEHVLGTDPARDRLVLDLNSSPLVPLAPADTPMLLTLTRTPSPFALAMIKHGDAGEISLYRAPLAAVGRPGTPWLKVCDRADLVKAVVVHEDDIYLLTSKDAPRFKIIRTREWGQLSKPI